MSISLKLLNPYKSITKFSDIEIPDFTVITGFNGAGKTHLLQAISEDFIRAYEHFHELTVKKFVTHSSLAPNDSGAVDSNSFKNARQFIIAKHQEYLDKKRQLPGVVIEQILPHDKHRVLLDRIADLSEKKIEDLIEDDFFKHYPIDDGLLVNTFFNQDFSTVFKRYHQLYEENRFNEFRSKEHNEGDYYTDDQFKKKHGNPPWELVEKYFLASGLNYGINKPTSLHVDSPFRFNLINNFSGQEINFSDLSSGEKIVMSLLLSSYNLKSTVEFPSVLLMDEPDSPLHPSMIKYLLNAIKEVFIDGRKIKVIMTTHSPSTIALCPEESIFIMDSEEPRLKKATKDTALSLLTEGVPTLSINYENRKQVFVESKNDQFFYEKMYRLLLLYFPHDISLDFICAGSGGSSSSEQVKDIVIAFEKTGNKQIFGIIDWDDKNQSKHRIKVHGEGARYSIENYIFDPLLFAIYLIREQIESKENYGLVGEDIWYNIATFGSDRLQIIVNNMLTKFADILGIEENENVDMKCELVGGYTILIPSWFMLYNGHKLGSAILSRYKEFGKFKNNEAQLHRDIIAKVFCEFPNFISKDTLHIFDSIRNNA